MEQARIDLWLSDFNREQKQAVMPEEAEVIDTGDYTLIDLLDQGEDGEDDREDDDWEIVRELFSFKKRDGRKNNNKTTRGSGVKTACAVKILESSVKKKRKKK